MAPSFLKKLSPVLIVMIIFSVLAIGCAIVVTLAARGTVSLSLPGDPARLEDLAWRIANFSVLVIFLHVALTNRIATFLSNRRSAIREALEEAVKARSDAEKKYEEVNRMIKKAKEEIEEIHSSFATEGQRERDRLIKNAQQEAEKIKKQAETTAVQEVRKARFALRAEAVDLAVEMAEEILKKNLKEADLKKVTQEFIKKAAELK
jgi:F-type H+-transporting ATPase subunit b